MPKTAIVIVNYRSWDPLIKCLHSIIAELSEQTTDIEVIVVDNNSADGRLASFQAEFPTIHWIENTVNAGFSAANDLGVAATQASRLIFLNPDTELPPGSLAQWINAFKKLPQPAIAGCPQVNLNGQASKVYDLFPGPFDALGFVRSLRRKKLIDRFSTGSRVVDWVTGSAVIIDRSSLAQLGGWGDIYWMYSEDVDLCKRAQEHGIGVYVTDTVPIVHAHGGATRRNPRITAITKSEVVRSKHIYAKRWFPGLSRLICHFLLASRALLKATLGSLLDLLLLHMHPSLQAQPYLLLELLSLYARRIVHGTWSSPRSAQII
ncbi:MAG: glycosyltransferase family 2 protein [Xanthomonadales bacterium]|nr:glycosyltransferase family 2 protein [Xanthomonadales bacterium]